MKARLSLKGAGNAFVITDIAVKLQESIRVLATSAAEYALQFIVGSLEHMCLDSGEDDIMFGDGRSFVPKTAINILVLMVGNTGSTHTAISARSKAATRPYETFRWPRQPRSQPKISRRVPAAISFGVRHIGLYRLQNYTAGVQRRLPRQSNDCASSFLWTCTGRWWTRQGRTAVNDTGGKNTNANQQKEGKAEAPHVEAPVKRRDSPTSRGVWFGARCNSEVANGARSPQCCFRGGSSRSLHRSVFHGLCLASGARPRLQRCSSALSAQQSSRYSQRVFFCSAWGMMQLSESGQLAFAVSLVARCSSWGVLRVISVLTAGGRSRVFIDCSARLLIARVSLEQRS